MAEVSKSGDSDAYQDDTDYQALRAQHQYVVDGVRTDVLRGEERFVDFTRRENRSDLTLDAVKSICRGKYLMYWKNHEVMKDPLDLVIYQQLMWELRPKTIFELGAYAGGTSAWMADIADSYGMEGHIYTVDIDISLIDERVQQNPRITAMEGDLFKIESVFPADMLKACPHPWLLIEDSHVNVVGTLSYFHAFMYVGDYWIIDDTNPDTPAISGMGLYDELGYERFGLGKLNELGEFMRDHGTHYQVDTYYTDMFGYNGTWNWNGYLRKMV